MTKRKIILTLKKIEKSNKEGYPLDALIRIYHLNIEALRFISLKLTQKIPAKNLKTKQILNELISEARKQPHSKIISKKSLKSLKPWLNKMDIYFKTLKLKQPHNTKSLFNETEKIFFILNISLTKIMDTR